MKNAHTKGRILFKAGAWTILVLILASFSMACSNPTGSSDLTQRDLKTLIDAAVAEKAGVSSSVKAPSEVPNGQDYVPTDTMDALVIALDNAQSVYAQANPTQAEINDAYNKLQNALDEFKRLRKVGSMLLDTAVVNFAITQAELLLAETLTANNANDVASGLAYSTPANKTALETAIQSALTGLDHAADATAVESILIDLQTAISIFENAQKHDGTKTTGFTQNALEDLADRAEKVKAGVYGVENSGDVPTGKIGVEQDLLDNLDEILVEIAEALNNPGSNNIDQLYLELANAIKEISDGAERDAGEPPSKADLYAAINKAQSWLDDVVINTDASKVEEGQFFVSQAVYNALSNAITAAKAVANNPNSTAAIAAAVFL